MDAVMIASPTNAENVTADVVPAANDARRILWERVCETLHDQLGEAVYRSWMMPLKLTDIHAGCATLSAPTKFMCEWVRGNYADVITSAFKQHSRDIYSVDIILGAQSEEGGQPSVVATAGLEATTPERSASQRNLPTSPQASETIVTPDAMGASLDTRYTFDNYVVGKPNELAYAAARRVSESAECIAGCNPLFLYGGVGLGKTHLMHAIAWHIRQTNPSRRVVYLSAEKFMYQFIKALRYNETMTFKEQFRSVDVLMVDDVQFISGKDSTQEEFFHTFNALIDQNKQLVISADRSPSDLEGIEERIRSRLGWGLVADIHATSYELRYGILQSKAEKMTGTLIPEDVLEFLAQRITTNIRELEGALNRVVAHTTFVGKPITLENTQDLLQDLLRSCDKRVTVEEIQKQVADYYNIKVSDMHSARRSVTIARPRQMAMYLSKQLTSKSLPEIGRKFGGKDHTTVMHAVKRIAELMQMDDDLRDDMERLQRTMCR